MRTVFIGAGELSIATAKQLIKKGHEVIIIEVDESIIDEHADTLDCSFLHGDGSKPEVLREVSPEQTDFLFCLSSRDQANVIAGLVGRSLGFKRVITSIAGPELEPICRQLGLENTIIPSRTISRYLVDMIEDRTSIELSSMIKDEARLFMFVATDQEAGKVKECKLPSDAKVVCLYRNGEFMLASDETSLKKADEVIILTHAKNLKKLQERWSADADGSPKVDMRSSGGNAES